MPDEMTTPRGVSVAWWASDASGVRFLIDRSRAARDVMFRFSNNPQGDRHEDGFESGATLAAAAATLFLAGAAVSSVSTTAFAAGGHCVGANACKGQSACKGAANSCKGLNACKGQGFSQTSEKSCDKIGGKFVKS